MSCKPRTINKFISLISISCGGLFTFGAINVYRGEEKFYSKFLMPITRYLDPERSHSLAIFLTKHKILRCKNNLDAQSRNLLRTQVFGIEFENPVGISAGFDKNSDALAGIPNYGVGFSEVGTVTPQPQEGNPKPRIFRGIKDRALINRCGFNSKGIDYVKTNLAKQQSVKPLILGLNLGKNKNTSDPSQDYLEGLRASKDLSNIDFLVINISSPNTVGLRQIQNKQNLAKLLDDILEEMNILSINKPLLLKIAPDIDDEQIKDIADVVMSKKKNDKKVAGLILTNTTISRPKDFDKDMEEFYMETGGLSGVPLNDMSTKVIAKFYKLTNGKVPIIGVGGIFNGQDAYDKIKAGASLVQLYTALTYEGPPVIGKIKKELSELVLKDGLSCIKDAVGIDHKTPSKQANKSSK